jgi:non-ribosomal peptide synthetase component F
MTMLAALKALICEVTGEVDVLIGLPLAARFRPELDGLIGCFRKRAILRTDVSGNPTFRELLRRVREVSVGAYLHTDLSLELAFPDRNFDHPVHWKNVHTSFNYVEGVLRPLELAGLSLSSIDRSYHHCYYRNDLMASEFNGELRLSLRALQGLYSVARAELILEEFHALLERIATDPDRRIHRAPVSRLRDDTGPRRNRPEPLVLAG